MFLFLSFLFHSSVLSILVVAFAYLKKWTGEGEKTVVAFVVDDLPAAAVGFGTNYNLFI